MLGERLVRVQVERAHERTRAVGRRQRQRLPAARAQAQRGVLELGLRRRERNGELAEHLRVRVQRVARLTPLPVGELGPPRGHAGRLAPARYDRGMCRNIRVLYNFEPPATDEEVRGAALQYVRKISGFTKPSQANEAAFERAVDAVAEASAALLDELVTNAAPKDREVEAAKARARSAQRYAA